MSISKLKEIINRSNSIVFFGGAGVSTESNILEASRDYISNTDVFIVGGTSLSVYPATGLVSYYKGNKLILINKTQTTYDKKADLIFHCNIGEVLNKQLNG